MATMSFIVPDDLKKAFDKAYQGQNKSAVITELMKERIAKEVKKRAPPAHFAGQVKELGDVYKTLTDQDWGQTE